MYKNAEVKMVVCPYNRSHTVSKLRLQKHITKCMEKYPEVKLASCFYNYSHRFKPEDMLDHYEVCCNKTRIDGAKYESFCSTSSEPSRESDPFTDKFPDINVKPKIFTSKISLSPCLNETFNKFHSSSPQPRKNLDTSTKEDNSDNEKSVSDDSDDELEPLPLPKTPSKAFLLAKQKSSGIKTEAMHSGFGRAKNHLSLTRHQQGLRAQKLDDLEYTKWDEKKSFMLSSLVNCCNTSVTSSVFDDDATLKSESIIFDENISEDQNIPDFDLNSFDKCTKIST